MEKPDIGIVLKALNNPLRREILLYLNEKRTAKFTDLYEHVLGPSKSTGQFSYHLNLLVDAQIIKKSGDSYSLTPIGEKATGMIKLIDIEVNTSIAQKISASFAQLSPLELVTVSWSLLPLVISSVILSESIAISLNSLESILLNILGGLAMLGVGIYAYSRLQYIPSLLALTNVIWIFFLQDHHLTFFTIYIFAGVGTALLLTGALVELSTLMVIVGTGLLLGAIVISVRFVFQQNRKGVVIRIT